MLNNIINTCQNFNKAFDNRWKPTSEDVDTLEYFNLDLAKSIIQDLDDTNAERIAKIILGFVE